MMREIKFRAWDSQNKKMLKVAGVEIISGRGIVSVGTLLHDEVVYGKVNGSNLSLNQFTGIHDKNGREIYECDIVRSIPRSKHEKSFVGAVHYGRVDPSFTIHDKDGHDFRLYSSGKCRTYEVIGNIFEDKQLLEAGE
ncbi:YopX family protein [Lacticaseibacillus mingshuiensis]|uniref:YopX family protein n=1 Tax=Lacticaseibacillus mingshuiensis TaxID=2799574 RepID=UPI00194E1861|nr:YopX family protein [Lacticaseibacillus mingshuiensis]